MNSCFRFVDIVMCSYTQEFPLEDKAHYLDAFIHISEPGSSVSIVSEYWLDDRPIEVRSSAEAKGFFLHPLCPDRLWGPPSLLSNGTGVPFPGGKARPGRDADYLPPPSAEFKNE
jgi:hypothetical protein